MTSGVCMLVVSLCRGMRMVNVCVYIHVYMLSDVYVHGCVCVYVWHVCICMWCLCVGCMCGVCICCLSIYFCVCAHMISGVYLCVVCCNVHPSPSFLATLCPLRILCLSHLYVTQPHASHLRVATDRVAA